MKELRNLEMESTMKRAYIEPSIEVIKQAYNEGLMTTLSIPISTIPDTGGGGGDAKPGGEWGNTWNDWGVENYDHSW